ncbi:hypothetical protein [Nocardia veterana]|uniref:Uncharacterized protein n=1 Tax=Nocardia veterana TaxID=132249 RepID=A0A7X6LYZ3_9NOCA|nr:hypothetical protein [Nocardia veterana]NKY87225.1 hypothetical protein [Nocardia veterana]
MSNRNMIAPLLLAMMPVRVWLVVGVVVAVLTLLGGCTVLVLAPVSTQATSAANNLHYQCDGLIGPDPDLGTRAVPTPSETFAPEDLPTENPFAKFTVEPGDSSVSDWMRACAAVITSAPYLQAASTAPSAAYCAALVLSGATVAEGGSDMARLTRWVVYTASVAAVTGRCDPVAVDAVPQPTGRDACDSSTAVVSGRGKGAVVLPMTISEQAICGARVSGAATAGDLVFWDYRKFVPARVGIASGPDRMVAPDPSTGKVVEQPIPTGSDVRIKRVLGGAA